MSVPGWQEIVFAVLFAAACLAIGWLKEKGYRSEEAMRRVRRSWRRTWDRLGRLEARDRARKQRDRG